MKYHYGWKVFTKRKNLSTKEIELKTVCNIVPSNKYKQQGFEETFKIDEWNKIPNKTDWGPYTIFKTRQAARSFKDSMWLNVDLIVKKIKYVKSKRTELYIDNENRKTLNDVIVTNNLNPNKIDLAEAFLIIGRG